MKKVLAIILFLFMSAGFLFAFTLSDSTVTVGIGFDTISGSGYSYDTGESFNSRILGGSAYLLYDVRLGQSNWFTRLGYEYILLQSYSVFKDVPYSKESGYSKSASKNRGGVYYAYNASKVVGFCLGVSLTDITMKMTNNETGIKLTNSFYAIGLIADCQFFFSEKLSARFSLNPDFIFLTTDKYHLVDGTYELTKSRSGFSAGYAVGAKVGLSYRF